MTILRILQLLLQIYPQIYISHQTTDEVNKKEKVEIAKGREEHL